MAIALKQYNQWYLENGARKLAQVVVPELHPFDNFLLPAYSTIHYLQAMGGGFDSEDGLEEDTGLVLGPNSDEVTLLNYRSAQILIKPVVKYAMEPVGESRIVINTLTEAIAKYIGSAANFKLLDKNLGLLTDKNLGVYAYTALESVYAYNATNMSAWHSFCNWYSTVLITLKGALESQKNRQHYLLIEPPMVMNSLSTLRDVGRYLQNDRPYAERLPPKYFKMFRTVQEKLFLDLWFFFGTNRQSSLFNEIIGTEELSRINILWQVGSKWTVVNLGRLDSMMVTEDNQKAPMTPQRMESNFLVHVMRLGSHFNVVDNGAPEDDHELSDEEKVLALDAPVRELNIETSKVTGGGIDIKLERPDKKSHALSQSAALMKLKQDMKAIDKEKAKDAIATDEVSDEVIEAAITRDLDQLEAISAQRIIENTYEDRYQPYVPNKSNNLDGVNKAISELEKRGKLSAKEVARLRRMALSFQETKNPWGGNETIAEFMEIPEGLLKVDEVVPIADKIEGVVDAGMLNSSITNITKDYVSGVLRKDIMNAVMHLQNGPYVVTDVKVQRHVDVMNDFETMTAKILTTTGKEKSIKIQYPTIKPDGTYLVGGVKQRLRSQHVDLPIRKVSPTRVAMTSDISKIFIERTDRAAFNYTRWLSNSLRLRIMDEGSTEFKNVVYGKAFDSKRSYPRAYASIAMSLKSFDYLGYHFDFDYTGTAKTTFTEQQFAFAKKHKVIPIASNDTDGLYMAMDGLVVKSQGDDMFTYGSIEKLLKLDENKAPVDYVEYNLLGDTVPLGIILAYHLGLGNLLATLGSKPRRVTRGGSYELKTSEFIVKFQDEALIFDRSDKVTALLLSGFNRYKRDISRMSIYQFDTQDAYATLLAGNKINPRKLSDVDSMMLYWVDHITAELLAKRGYPTDLVGLMIKATEMLTSDKHSDPNAASEQRERGQERIAGAIYKELYNAARSHMGKSLVMSGGFDLNPNAVWYRILNDTANMGVEESNPIHFLKEQEEVTLGGDGGRTGRTLMGKDRKFSPESMGVISEATVDSGEVAAKIFTTADPNYSTLRGETRQLPKGVNLNEKATRLQSTSMLLAAGADRDDPKRRNFISVQNSSSTFAVGYTPMPLGTGYERVMVHRTGVTGDLWSKIAQGEGEVVSVKNGVITVKYDSGETDVVELGVRHGVWAGKTVPHEVITDLKAGDKVSKGTPIAYNKHYYSKDSLYSNQVVFKNATLARTVIWESDATFEDSSAITEELAERLMTKFTKRRTVSIDFDFGIRDAKEVGDLVEADDLLCVLYPPLSTDAANRHDEVTRDLLERLSTESPQAKKRGVITNIDVRYSGDPEEMSESLREFVEHHDGILARKRKQMKEPLVDGSTAPNVRIDGTEVGTNRVVVEYKIDYDLTMVGGDKLVWAHQLKSVPCEVITGGLETMGGVKIDGIFGALSVEDRMVRSVYLIGTTNRLLNKTGEDACAIFFRNALNK